METSKAFMRRLNEGWFDKYAPEGKPGIDIGCQHDPLREAFRKYDLIFGDPDATFMENVEDNSYFTVYSSHILEHVDDPVTAVKNWFRILQPGGHLIILVPHRDLYEKKRELPSNWNFDHRSMWLPNRSEKIGKTQTYCLKEVILKAGVPEKNIISYKVLADGYCANAPNEHPEGEYSIEAIIQK